MPGSSVHTLQGKILGSSSGDAGVLCRSEDNQPQPSYWSDMQPQKTLESDDLVTKRLTVAWC